MRFDDSVFSSLPIKFCVLVLSGNFLLNFDVYAFCSLNLSLSFKALFRNEVVINTEHAMRLSGFTAVDVERQKELSSSRVPQLETRVQCIANNVHHGVGKDSVLDNYCGMELAEFLFYDRKTHCLFIIQ
jgi:hypothetical protein